MDRTFAERFWPGQDAVGRRVQACGGNWYTLVGATEVTRRLRLHEADEPIIVRRPLIVALAALLAASLAGSAAARQPRGDALRVAQRRHGLDPSSPIASRVKLAPASLLEEFHGGPPPPDPSGRPGPRPPDLAASHTLTEAERRAFEAAIDGLTPLQKRVLQARLQAVYFVDAPNMPGTALTRTVNPHEPAPLFDVVIRGSVFRETVAEWLTAKERTCFDASRSPLRVSVEAGTLEAIRYAMLHEASHMTDQALRLTPTWRPEGPPPDPGGSPFTRGLWKSPLEIAAPYSSAVLQEVTFRPGTLLSAARAPEVYGALARTPFVSLYASRSWSEDIAELVAVSHWVGRLGQPFRFVVRDGAREVFAYEPMRSPLVRERLPLVARFYREP